MTDEERARAYIIEIYDLRKDLELWRIKRDAEWRMVFNAYLAGLKAGRPQWHKVADGEYPPKYKGFEYSEDVITDEQERAYYDYTFHIWYGYVEGVEMATVIEPPVAWCELPKYAEE